MDFSNAHQSSFKTTGETWEEQDRITREKMVRDIMRRIELDREKMKKDPTIEPFSFEDLVNSSRKTIWLGEADRKVLCAEALFRLLPKNDYRYGNKKAFLESIHFEE